MVTERMTGGSSFKLDLKSRGIRAHPVINVKFLRKYTSPDTVPFRQPAAPDPIAGVAGDQPEWEVEEVVSHKRTNHKNPRWLFTVKWSGLGVGEMSVEPLSALVDLDDLHQVSLVTEPLVNYARRHEDVWELLLSMGWDPLQ